MSKKLTPKQAKFCQAYVECGNASEAYRQAYNAENMGQDTIKVKASQLLAKDNVGVTVAELQAEHKERHNVTVDSIIAELKENRAMALEDRNINAANTATMGKAKVVGLLVDKVDATLKTFALEETDGGKTYRKG